MITHNIIETIGPISPTTLSMMNSDLFILIIASILLIVGEYVVVKEMNSDDFFDNSFLLFIGYNGIMIMFVAVFMFFLTWALIFVGPFLKILGVAGVLVAIKYLLYKKFIKQGEKNDDNT